MSKNKVQIERAFITEFDSDMVPELLRPLNGDSVELDQEKYPLSTARLRAKQLKEQGVNPDALFNSIEQICDKDHRHDSSCYDIPAELK